MITGDAGVGVAATVPPIIVAVGSGVCDVPSTVLNGVGVIVPAPTVGVGVAVGPIAQVMLPLLVVASTGRGLATVASASSMIVSVRAAVAVPLQ